jgi:hypothetical protein
VVAVEIDGLVLRVGHDRGGLFQLIGDRLLSRCHDDRRSGRDPAQAQLAGQGLLADDHRVVGGVGQGHDGLDLVVAHEAPHRPGFLPGASIDFPRLHFRELVGEDVIVSMPPDLPAGEDRQGYDEAPLPPEAPVIMNTTLRSRRRGIRPE